jgi:hypothetical protein
VPADTLEDDFDRLFDESMSELFDGPLVPLADNFVQSGLEGLAATSSGTLLDGDLWYQQLQARQRM